ncbi:MAG: metallophosphoesterase [Deltaproteobacteria bacterium]|nr:metallophosphoesterase [Deltaproteobacteria bacterium]
MIIGIISDSHDNITLIKKAISLLNERNVNMVIHAGDYVAPFTVRLFKEFKCPWIGVFGNNDGEKKGLTVVSESRIQEPPYELNLGGKSVYITHDINVASEDGIIPGRDIIIFGHDHQASIKRINNQLYINPGELCGYVSGKSTIAILNTEKMEAEIIEIPIQ